MEPLIVPPGCHIPARALASVGLTNETQVSASAGLAAPLGSDVGDERNDPNLNPMVRVEYFGLSIDTEEKAQMNSQTRTFGTLEGLKSIPARSTRHVAQSRLHGIHLGLQCSLGNAATHRLLHARFTNSHADDPYGQEADRIADALMRMPDPAVGMSHLADAVIQRRCRACDHQIDREMLEEEEAPILPNQPIPPVPLQRQPQRDEERQPLHPKRTPAGGAMARRARVGEDAVRRLALAHLKIPEKLFGNS
jgi:hypothetical protein